MRHSKNPKIRTNVDKSKSIKNKMQAQMKHRVLLQMAMMMTPKKMAARNAAAADAVAGAVKNVAVIKIRQTHQSRPKRKTRSLVMHKSQIQMFSPLEMMRLHQRRKKQTKRRSQSVVVHEAVVKNKTLSLSKMKQILPIQLMLTSQHKRQSNLLAMM